MTTLHEWAVAWGVPHQAVADLELRVLLAFPDAGPVDPGGKPTSEAAVQAAIRLEASAKGLRMWRNNVGAGYSEDGSFMRWGLANDSKAVNKVLKSGDLIGIRPVIITPAHVGWKIGQFVSREVKASDWRYRGTEREIAQNNWAQLVLSLGGDAGFATEDNTL